MSVFDEGFFNRFKSSVDRVLCGLDIIVASLFTLIIYCFADSYLSEDIAVRLFDSATPLITTLIIVIVTSVSILVSVSSSNAITQLKKKQLYRKFLFTFEYTAILALISAVVSILAQTLNAQYDLFYIFVFLLSYTILAVGTVISRLITYGDKVAQISLAKDLPDDLDKKVTEIHAKDDIENTETETESNQETSEVE